MNACLVATVPNIMAKRALPSSQALDAAKNQLARNLKNHQQLI